MLRNGYTSGNGGALSLPNGAFVDIFDCIVDSSSAVNGGGALVDSGSNLVISGSSIGGNTASWACSPASLSALSSWLIRLGTIDARSL